jgi:hypothetical protein
MVPVLAQDSFFTPTDVAVLARFGVRVVGALEAVHDMRHAAVCAARGRQCAYPARLAECEARHVHWHGFQ